MDVRFMHLATDAAQELSSCSPCRRRTQSFYMHTLHVGLLIEICSLSLVAYHGRTRGFFSKIQVDMLRRPILLDL